jgi:hypothetical protein
MVCPASLVAAQFTLQPRDTNYTIFIPRRRDLVVFLVVGRQELRGRYFGRFHRDGKIRIRSLNLAYGASDHSLPKREDSRDAQMSNP